MKNVLVTGGLQGIGRSIVDELKNRGDRIFVFDCIELDDDRVVSLEKDNIFYFKVDVREKNSVEIGFQKVFILIDQNESGAGKLDVLVNNAGITRDGLALRMKQSDWNDVLSVNLSGSFLCAQQALKRMVRQESSYIINISSVVALTGNQGQSNYSASKAGLIGLTKSLALEYASRGVRVNAILPGFIKTAMTDNLPIDIQNQILDRIPLKRFGLPRDISLMVDFLTSGKADYITGQAININGGLV